MQPAEHPFVALLVIGKQWNTKLGKGFSDEVAVALRNQLLMSTAEPSCGTLAGMTTSTPYGLPSVFSSIQHSTRSRSSASLNRTHPSTPSPPALVTAAATFSDGVKTKI